MKFRISDASSWEIEPFLYEYEEKLKPFNLTTDEYDDENKYDANAYIELNSLDDLIKLGKAVDEELVINVEEGTIVIYDDYLE